MAYKYPLPKELRGDDGQDKLRQLGVEIAQEIDLAETAKGGLPQRWEKNEQLYNVDPKATNLNIVEGLASYPIPLWKPKADRIVSQTLKAITGIDPYVQCIPLSQAVDQDATTTEKAERLAKGLTKFATFEKGRDGFDRAFRLCLKTAVNTGIAILYIKLEQVKGKEAASTKFECIHPKNFMIYTHELGSIQRARTVGHRVWKYRWEIEQGFEAGEYLTDEVGGADLVGDQGGKAQSFAKTVDTPTRTPDDQHIECWQVCRKCDLGDGWKDYVVLIAKKSMTVLSVKELPYKQRPYFDIRFDDEYGSFWPACSPGQDMQGLQLFYSDIFNTLIHGGYAAAFPGVALIGATLNTKVKRWGPGTVWELPQGADVKVVGTAFNGEYLVKMLEPIQDLADSTSRVSRLGTSSDLPASTTATAAAGFLQAQQQGQDQYSNFVAPTIGYVFEFLRELLEQQWDKIKAYTQTDFGMQPEDVMLPCELRPTGQTSTNSPSTLIQKLQLLLQMAQAPATAMDYQAIEKQVIQALEFPFDPVGLEKKGPSVQDLTHVLAGIAAGQVSMQEVAQICQELGINVPVPPQQDTAHLNDIHQTLVGKITLYPEEEAQILKAEGIEPDPRRFNGQTNPGDAGPQGQPPTSPNPGIPAGPPQATPSPNNNVQPGPLPGSESAA